jgi:hypothetical protein
MTSALSSIGLPHWLMIAGSLLVLLGFAGLLLRKASVQAEPDSSAGEQERDVAASEQEIFNVESDLTQVEQAASPVKQERPDRWAERERALKEASDVGPEFYGERST